MLTRADLLERRCRHLDGAPMEDAAIAAQLAALPGWRHDGGVLRRDFRFADFASTIAFVNAVARLADHEDHHPELHVGYGRCAVEFNTHSVGGISENDFICAAKVDALTGQPPDAPG
jgi:4a-hydroxytetrahydrobiopterin dehydratase